MNNFKKKTAIMQPYFFPSISYFRLIYSVDTFVFLDDVNFIKKGWINRNKILINNEARFINVNCNSSSQNKKINEIEIKFNTKEKNKTLQKLMHAYKKAPHFVDIFPILSEIILSKYDVLSEYASNTVISILDYLDVKRELKFSSKDFKNTSGFKGEKRIIEICKQLSSHTYINAQGGKNIYSKKSFIDEQINLFFINSIYPNYKQFNGEFIPNLSIIDLLMFNSKKEATSLLKKFDIS